MITPNVVNTLDLDGEKPEEPSGVIIISVNSVLPRDASPVAGND